MTGPVDVNGLTNLQVVVGLLWNNLEGVGTKVISLGLQQVGWQVGSSVTIVEGESSGESWCWDTVLSSERHSLSPAGLGLGNGISEELVEQQVLQLWVLLEGLCDFTEEDGSDDTTTSPHEGNCWEVEVPLVLLSSFSDQHETLGVGDDLGGVQSLLQVVNELLLVLDGVLWNLRTWQDRGGLDTLTLNSRQTSGKDSLTDKGQWDTQVQGVHCGPLTSTLLASLVQDLLNKRSAIGIVVVQDISGDLDQEGVQDTLVPLRKHITNLLVGQATNGLHDVVGLRDELHVTVLDTVVHHLDVVTGTCWTNPVTTWLTVRLSRDGLEDLLDVWPSLGITTWHERRTVTGTFLTTRHTGTNETDALTLQLLVSSVGVWEVGVTTVNDDVTLLKVWQELLDEGIDSSTRLDEQDDSSWSLQVVNELLDGSGTDDGLALGLVLHKVVNLGDGSVESNNGVTVVGSVEDQVLTHDGQTDKTNITSRRSIAVSIWIWTVGAQSVSQLV